MASSEPNSSVRKVNIGGTELYLLQGHAVNCGDDAAEHYVTIKIAKEGSTLSGFCRALGQAISTAAGHGDDVLRDYLDCLAGQAFAPAGATTDPEIPIAQSICDYIAKRLRLDWGVGPDSHK